MTRKRDNFLEQIRRSREAAKAKSEQEPTDPEEARLDALGVEIQDFRRRVEEAPQPVAQGKPGASGWTPPRKRRRPWK
jgi:hypothetical protein